jgi:hypothetical protein
MAADVDVDMAANMDIDVVADMDDDNPCIYGPISNLAQIFYLIIFGLLIILIQPIFRIWQLFKIRPIFQIQSFLKFGPFFKFRTF